VILEEERQVYIKALKRFGHAPQKVMFMEEAAELTKELSKSMRGKENIDDICEEIADVQIMLDQLKVMYGERECRIKFYEKFKRLEGMLDL
jgi:NTP pyrophosphatase (non-canonical NTP hydrolase)